MKKKLTVLLALMVFVLTLILSSCAADPDDKIIVAKIDGKKITKSEFNKDWALKKQEFGITDDILASGQYADQIKEIKEDVLDALVTQKVTRIELGELGYYNFSPEEEATIQDNFDSFISSLEQSGQQAILATLDEGYSERDYVKAVNEYIDTALGDMGIDIDYVEEYFSDTVAMENADAELVDMNISEEDLQRYFDNKVESDKELFTDLVMYESYTMQSDYESYFIPEGIRFVRHVLIGMDDEAIAEIRTLRGEGNDEDADALLEASLEDISEKANEVLTKLEEGTITFDEAIEQYNDDPGMASNPEGYQMFTDTIAYVPEFTEAGMALKNVGDISGLVASDFGYHILEYTSDYAPGPVDFESVRASVEADAPTQKRNEQWTALSDEWLAKHEIEYFYENLVEDIPDAPAVLPIAE